ncbi:hypothetical protein [Hymenobacter antarcticus]|uniref:Addiction module component n=1 Tax=Hymenobacter antarcticus TaxID=486270 RepID=A0ABP7PKH5_9BACT
MTTALIIREISKLPWTERLLVVEKTLRSIRQDKQRSLAQAVDALYQDYAADADLTAFTQIDVDSFYEAK